VIRIANLVIIDTGYLTITSTGNQATMANSGSAINLKSVDIDYQGGGNIDDSPIINPSTTGAPLSTLNFGSSSNAKITIRGVINRKTISTTLNEELTSSDTTITLTSTSEFMHYGRIKIDSELIDYSGISGNDLTGCVRGVGDTTAASHSSTTTTTTSNADLMDDLNNLRKTIGIKLLYYSSITDGFRDITDSIGSTDVTHLSGTTPHIHVRVTNFTIKQSSKSNILRYTLEMVETA